MRQANNSSSGGKALDSFDLENSDDLNRLMQKCEETMADGKGSN